MTMSILKRPPLALFVSWDERSVAGQGVGRLRGPPNAFLRRGPHSDQGSD